MACRSPSRRISTWPASTVSCNAGSQFTSGVPGLNIRARTPRKSAACALASAMQSSASTTTTPSCEHSSASASRACAERRCATSRSIMALMLSRIIPIEASSAPSSSALPLGTATSSLPAAMRSATLEATATGPTIRRASAQATSAESSSASAVPAILSCRSRATVARARLPVEEAVAGGVVDQQIDLFVDLGGVVIERLPVDVELGAVEQPLADAVPGVHRASAHWSAAWSARIDCERCTAISRSSDSDSPSLSISSSSAARIAGSVAIHRRANAARMAAKSVGRRARIVDRHQRFVEVLSTSTPAFLMPKMA